MLSPSDIYRLINDYIGVEGGYLGNFSYRTHREFYPAYCGLEIDVDSYGSGTTRQKFIRILESASPQDQIKIVKGVFRKYPVSSFPQSQQLRKQELFDEFQEIITRLDGTVNSRPEPPNSFTKQRNIETQQPDGKWPLQAEKLREDEWAQQRRIAVDSILASSVRMALNGTTQNAARIIFGDMDSLLTYSQKRSFLIAVEELHFRDNLGQDHIRSDFTLIEGQGDELSAQEVVASLKTLCELGLLTQINKNPSKYTFAKRGETAILNYLLLREFYEGGGRAKMSPNLSHKRVVFQSIPVSAKGFIQLMKSFYRRVFEARTGVLLNFQNDNEYDYDQVTRLAYSLQAPSFFIDPALSLEVVPLEPTKVKVIAECYHFLAEDFFRQILEEVSSTWPSETIHVTEQAFRETEGDRVPPSPDQNASHRIKTDQALREKIRDHFNVDELKTLCQDLGINYENLSGDTLEGKARELVEYGRRHNRIQEIINFCQRARLFVKWD